MSTRQPPAPRRRTAREITKLRREAKAAAISGERLASIAARLDIPRASLTDWARADGFRQCDIAAARKAQGAVCEAATEGMERRDGEAEADYRLRLSRARAAALLEAGMIEAAEAEMKSGKRLDALARYIAPHTEEAEKGEDDVEWTMEFREQIWEELCREADRIEAEKLASAAASEQGAEAEAQEAARPLYDPRDHYTRWDGRR